MKTCVLFSREVPPAYYFFFGACAVIGYSSMLSLTAVGGSSVSLNEKHFAIAAQIFLHSIAYVLFLPLSPDSTSLWRRTLYK